MATGLKETTLTTFLRSSGAVLEEVEDHDVILRRRDGADLMLVRADREAVLRDALETATTLLSTTLSSVTEALLVALRERLPWMRFLPPEDQEAFVREFVEMAEACASIGSFDRLAELLAQWRNTAYVWSRPELAQDLQRDFEDDAPVPKP